MQDQCLPGAEEQACGREGDACVSCGEGQVCSVGRCVASGSTTSEACGPKSCSGCCSGDVCLAGDTSWACGSGGEPCAECGHDYLCEERVCIIDDASRWDVIALDGVVPPTKLDGQSWDPLGGLPDPRVTLATGTYVLGDFVEGKSAIRWNTLTPVWNEAVLVNIPARSLKSSFSVVMKDYDSTSFDDHIGSCQFSMPDHAFAGLAEETECGKDVIFRFLLRPTAHH